MSTSEKWKSNVTKLRIISVIEIIFLVTGAVFSFQFSESYSSYIFFGVIITTFSLHIAALLKYWRCPKCNKVQPFWEKHHRASVGSLQNCVYCGVPYV